MVFVSAAASRGMLRSVGYVRCGVRRLSTRPHGAFVCTRESSCLARKSASPVYARQKTRVGRLPAVQRFDRRAFSQETWVSPFAKPTAAGAFILRTKLSVLNYMLQWLESRSPDDEAVFSTLKAISLIHLKLGDIGTSVPLLERALAKEIEFYGTENVPSVLDALEALSGLHVMMGKKKEVAATMERLLAATIQVKGEDHPDAARLTRDVARGRGFLGDHAGKKAMLLKALELQRALFGRSYMEDLDYSRTLLFLASAHVLLGEVEDANRIVDSVIEVLDRRPTPKANEQNLGVHLLHIKAIMEGALGRPSEKAVLLTDLIGLLEQQQGLERVLARYNIVQLKHDLALAAAENNEAEQAKKYLQEAEEERKALEMADGHDYPLLTSRTYGVLGDTETEIRLLREADEAGSKLPMAGDMQAAHTKHALARALRQRGDAESLAEAAKLDEANKAVLASLEKDRHSSFFVVDNMDRTRLAIMLETAGESYV